MDVVQKLVENYDEREVKDRIVPQQKSYEVTFRTDSLGRAYEVEEMLVNSELKNEGENVFLVSVEDEAIFHYRYKHGNTIYHRPGDEI